LFLVLSIHLCLARGIGGILFHHSGHSVTALPLQAACSLLTAQLYRAGAGLAAWAFCSHKPAETGLILLCGAQLQLQYQSPNQSTDNFVYEGFQENMNCAKTLCSENKCKF